MGIYIKEEDVVFNGSRSFGDDTVITPAALTTAQADYDPTGWRDGSGEIIVSVLQLQTDGSGNKQISGLVPSATAKRNIVLIINVGTVNNVVIQNNNAGSAAANRFLLNSNNSLAPNESAQYYYCTTASRWRPISDYK